MYKNLLCVNNGVLLTHLQKSVIFQISKQLLIQKGKYGQKLSAPKHTRYPGLSFHEGFFRKAPEGKSYEHKTENSVILLLKMVTFDHR